MDDICLFLNGFMPLRFRRWPWESEVRCEARLCLEFSRLAPAQMEERGREMMTRVRTLEPSSGTATTYWRIEKRDVHVSYILVGEGVRKKKNLPGTIMV